LLRGGMEGGTVLRKKKRGALYEKGRRSEPLPLKWRRKYGSPLALGGKELRRSQITITLYSAGGLKLEGSKE